MRAHPSSTVSIVTPAYNAARFLPETIRSVQAQTYPAWEMLIVDDGSDDDTPALVRAAAAGDPRIRLLASGGRRGPAGARNVALDAARSRYVAFLDSDDLWLPDKLEVQLAYMRERNAAFTFGGYRLIDEGGRVLGEPVRVPARLDYRLLLSDTIIGCLTVVLDRERTGPLRMPDLRQHEDLVLWFSVLKRGIVAEGIDHDFARYRVVRGSASRDKLRSARHMWKVYRDVEGLGMAESISLFASYAWNAYWKNRPGMDLRRGS